MPTVKQKHKFRLLHGQYAESVPQLDEDGTPLLKPDGTPIRQLKVYERGDIIETSYDLNKQNSPRQPKFERVDEAGQRSGGHLTVAEAMKQLEEAKAREANAAVTRSESREGPPVPVNTHQPLQPDVAKPQQVQLDPKTGKIAPLNSVDTRPQRPANLDQMTLRDIQAFAAEEEIDLKGARNADEAKKAVRAATVG